MTDNNTESTWRIDFDGIPGITPPCPVKLKIPQSRKPPQQGFTMTIEKTVIVQDYVGRTYNYAHPVTGHMLSITITPNMVGKPLIDVLDEADKHLAP